MAKLHELNNKFCFSFQSNYFPSAQKMALFFVFLHPFDEHSFMKINPLKAISPIDGRYRKQTRSLESYFSEYALIKYRLYVEIKYFIALCEFPLPQLKEVSQNSIEELLEVYNNFDEEEAGKIKDIEKTTNHDVKAVEYYIKEKMDELGMEKYKEFIHFGLTSQDINNTAIPLSIKDAVNDEYLPLLEEISELLAHLARLWLNIPMLAHTHGQPASPTLLGKELKVFEVRLNEQVNLIKTTSFSGKFGGATGNFNAHFVSYPDIDWVKFAKSFLKDKLGLKRSYPTTQIDHYDHLAALFDNMKRINTILIDLSRDIWQYISMGYFKQKINQNEVGSSTMPHKVNPIDFENAEGNFGIANALLSHLSQKLPISRLQRDLTDSTVLRNIGVAFGHSMIAFQSVLKGLNKIELNKEALDEDLNENWIVVGEGIQNILRREGYPNPYEELKKLTRNSDKITQKKIYQFIDDLNISDSIKEELKKITPFNYIGIKPD